MYWSPEQDNYTDVVQRELPFSKPMIFATKYKFRGSEQLQEHTFYL